MGVPKQKLTEWPEDLKDVIDWFLRVGGKDKESNGDDKKDKLKDAVKTLDGFDASSISLKSADSIQGLFNYVAGGLQLFIGYDNNGTHELTGEGIAAKSGYTSSYNDSAQWSGDSTNPTMYAQIFLGTIPFLYFGLTYTYWKCSKNQSGHWGQYSLNGGGRSPLYLFMVNMGFGTNNLQDITGSEVAERLKRNPIYGFDELKNAKTEQHSYSKFLTAIDEKHGKSTLTSNPTDCALYALHRASIAYLQSTFQSDESDQNLRGIKEKLLKFKKETKNYDDLETEVDAFLREINVILSSSSHLGGMSAADHFSPAGPVAGTLTTLGLGSAAAAYILNLGGAKTLSFNRPVDLASDSPSNLKEAIDWILRVTGKDGQDKGGQGATAIKALTEQVKTLLESVIGSDPGLKKDAFENVISALGNSGSDTLITKLADGLQQFIGYEGGSFVGSSNTTGKITGSGIAPSNMATHRLCDATIAFTIAVLEGCKNNEKVKLRKDQISKIDNVIKSLHEKYGQGPEKLQEVGGPMKRELNKTNFNGTGIDSFVEDIGTAFEKLKGISHDRPNDVAQKVGEYLKEVLKGTRGSWQGNADQAASKLQALVQKFKSNNIYDTSDNTFSQNIRNVENNLITKNAIQAVRPILEAAKGEFVWHLEKAYVSYYQGTPVDTGTRNSNNTEAKTCAQIFLGCMPLIYHCLTQFYWLCLDTKKRWDKYPFSGGGLRNLMVALGYGDAFLGGSTGSTVMTNVAAKLKELSTANDATSKPYPEFLNTLTSNLNDAINPSSSPNLTGQTIPALYHIAKLYFRHQHGRNVGKPRPPSSIREMLYWFSGLQFSPQYDSLQSHISSVFRSLLGKATSADDTELSLDVADSGATKDSNNKLSAVDLKGYLTMTCLYTPMVLGRLQGHGVSTGINEPYLLHLFGNGMSFAYPSGAALLSKLSEYAYALQFQLSFLTQQCFTHNGDGCGWRMCSKCGQAAGQGSPSPLQAFLTDKLHGFRRGHPSDPSSHLASCSAKSMCHVPMGFKAEYLRETPGYGYHVFYPLLFYCSDNTRPLRLLSDKLQCISNYTPRSLGDMFGFYLHLCLQVFNKRSNNFTFSSYITRLLTTQRHPSRAGLLIFEYLEGSIVELGSALHGVIRHCHSRQNRGSGIEHIGVSGTQCSHSDSSPADLWSLFSGMDNNHAACKSAKCGAYLSPLTRSNGSTFGKSAGFASTYLSWVSYLADDFKERLESLLTDFTNITCTECKTQNGKNCNCTKGNHGRSQCSCESVVSCSDVLSLFYDHGFNFLNVQSLSGKGSGNGDIKRTCNAFHSQLQTVINGDPLHTLLVAVDRFLYAIRW
ncbi:variant erythrocyte surface antigen-1 family protein [Babesia caballi]|uniref:Variant erythrocyte surface antigen-1 family protein n=1 Tax=Babesia caballi TaxID=5871 RepID=A0AAV4LWV1_BABCB|nr:variant erythrocyte surface antigen-1 family protein [Babesia caballi]